MRFVVVLLLLVMGSSIAVYADVYQWVDDKGVVNFTDNLENIPKKYQKKVKVQLSDDSGQEAASPVPAPPAEPGASAPQPLEQPAQQKLYDGHDERWWRAQYGALRGEVARLQASLPVKRAELEQLRRKLVIYTFTRNRIAYQDKLAEVQRDEERINALTEQLTALDTQAAIAGVPFDWRQ
ncbi:MAG: DUF4124 domain-containing protein [Geobacteraceae bacterium]|nr:DUF4124 domain-containing protein [Geobacteraceae bacterium]